MKMLKLIPLSRISFKIS